MFLIGYSHSSIVLWAKKNFPTEFQQLPGTKNVAIQLHKITSAGSQGYLKGLVIGHSTDERDKSIDVLAWLEDDCMIISYVTKAGSSIQVVRYDSAESVRQSVEESKEPFCWVL